MHSTRKEQIKDELGAVIEGFNTTLEKHSLVNGLVNCTGIESMFQLETGFCKVPEIKALIDLGELTVFGICSGKVLSDGQEIPAYSINGKPIEDVQHLWKRIHKLSDMQENYVIFHVQMLGVGTDLPSLNSVVILGDKNETDLFQTIMRGCRVDHSNPEKKEYEVFVFVDGETKAYMEKFINTLDKLGGPELISAFSNDVLQGEADPNSDPLFTELLQGRAGYNQVMEEYRQIVNCHDYLTKAAMIEAIQVKMIEYFDAGNMTAFKQLDLLLSEKLRSQDSYLQIQNNFLYYNYQPKGIKMKEYRMSEPVLLNTLKKLYGSLMAISGKKILVIRDLKIALLLAVRNSVVYVTDDPECAEQFRKNTEAGMGKDDVVILINKWTNKLKFTKVFEKMGMKFDICIQNPPYDRNLHLKILEAVIPHAEKVINISPVRWLQDPFAPYLTRSDYCKFENGVSKHIKDLEVIPAKNASQIFQEASFTMNLGIYTCDEQGGYNYMHNDPLVTKIVRKTMENSWEPFNVKRQMNNPQKQFVLNTPEFGNPFMANTYQRALQCQQTKTLCGGRKSCIFSFDTEEERKNFYDCYNTEFMKWQASLWKADAHIYCEKIPYFDDYTHSWKLKDFFAWFELTKEEQARVVSEIRQMRHNKRQ